MLRAAQAQREGRDQRNAQMSDAERRGDPSHFSSPAPHSGATLVPPSRTAPGEIGVRRCTKLVQMTALALSAGSNTAAIVEGI